MDTLPKRRGVSILFQRYKTFLIAFVVSILLFGAMFAVALYLMRQRDFLPVAQEVQNLPVDQYQPAEEDNMSVALMLCEERNALPVSYFYLKFDVVQGKLFILEVPKQTVVTVDTRTQTVERFYEYGGMEYAAIAIGTLFDEIDCRYVRADRETLQSGIDILEGIPYELDVPMQTEHYLFDAEEIQLDGRRMADLLLTPLFEPKADLVSALCSMRLNESKLDRLDWLYEALFKADTDITEEHLQNRAEAVEDALSHPLVTVSFSMDGIMADDQFLLDQTTMRSICNEINPMETEKPNT